MKTHGLNQDSDEIVPWLLSLMSPKNTSSIYQGYFPTAKTGANVDCRRFHRLSRRWPIPIGRGST
jgi:hypothetical protein